MIKDFFKLTFKAIRYRPVRSWLTILGVIIGVMLVTVILSLGSGIKNAVNELLSQFGSDYLIVFPGQETNPLAGFFGQRFREQDLLDLEQLPGVDFVVPMDVQTLNVEYRGEVKSVTANGGPMRKVQALFEASQGVHIAEGRWPQNEQANEVVLGWLVAHGMFKSDIAAGDEVIIKAKRLRVAGIMSKIGSQQDDNSIYLSQEQFRALTGISSGAITAFVKVLPDANIDLVARQVKYELSQQDVVRDFTVLTPAKTEQLAGSILSLIELAFIALGLFSLVVGAVGIMNSTYTSVLERTKQIGIMKAIGASSDAVMSLFLIESGVIGLVGGLIGIIFGIGIAALIGWAAAALGDFKGLFSFAALDYFGFGAILVFTFIVGVLSGILPARQASRMDPAEALRYE